MSTALLLQCIRAELDLDAIRTVISSGVDWETALPQAERHGLEPLLYWTLNRACPDLAPAPVLETLRVPATACAQRCLGFTAEMFRVLDALHAQGRDVIAFKGPVTAWTLYESPGLREIGDLDLWIAPAYVGAARKVLTGLGYQPLFSPNELKFHPILQMAFAGANGMQVDLHWHLAPPPYSNWFDSDAVRARAAAIWIARREVWTLSPPDLLRFLCFHAARHGWISLRDVCDVARLMHSGVNCEEALADAETFGGSRVVLLGLALARNLAGAELPPMLSERVNSERGLAALVARATQNLIQSPDLRLMSMFRWHWILLHRPIDRVRLLWGYVLPNPLDREWMPGLPYAVYFFVKPMRLIVEYLSLIATRLL